MDIKMSRSKHGGLSAETRILLPGVKTKAMNGDEGGEAMLSITTSKRSRGLSSSATVITVRPGGIVSFVIFADYSKTVAVSGDRATEKAIRELHATALAKLPTIMAEVGAHYTKE